MESVNSHEEGVVERTDHGTNTAAQIAGIHVNVVNAIVPIRFLRGGESCQHSVSLLNHVVVVAVVKRAVEQVGVRRKVPNELPWVLSPCGSVVAAVAVGVLEHEKVDIVPCPTVVEIEGPVQRRKAELGDDLHRSIEAARRRPVDRILNHCAANGINAPPGR